MPVFFKLIREYKGKKASIPEATYPLDSSFLVRKKEAKDEIAQLQIQIKTHLNSLDDRKKAAIISLLEQAPVAIDKSTSTKRINDLIAITTWANKVVQGKPFDSEYIFPLLATELDQWGGLYNSKTTRVLVGLSAIILGLAAAALYIYLCLQLLPLFVVTLPPEALYAPVLLSLLPVIWGILTIFDDHVYNLSSELKEFTQCFESPEEGEEVDPNAAMELGSGPSLVGAISA